MNAEITDKDIEHAIDACQWRLNVGGVYVCKGMCGSCVRVIENGQCDTLQNLFKKGTVKPNDKTNGDAEYAK